MSKKNTSVNWNALGRIPFDLLFDILSSQSVKTLCKLKCVSKEWRRLIQSPNFVEKVRCDKPLLLEIGFPNGDEVDVAIMERNGIGTILKRHHLQDEPRDLKFCQGLICYSQRTLHELIVYNVTTGEDFYIPEIPCLNYEFGFEPSSNKYKLLCWDWVGSEMNSRNFHLLTLGEKVWKPLIELTGININNMYNTVTSKGIMAWTGDQNGGPCIVLCNLATETFGVIEYPPEVRLRPTIQYALFEFDSSVCLVEYLDYEHIESLFHLKNFQMWMLKDVEKNVWVSIMKDPVLPIEGTDLLEYADEAHFSSIGTEIFVATADQDRGRIFVYCFLTDQFRRIDVKMKDHTWFFVRPHVQNYVRFSKYVYCSDDDDED